MGDCIHPGCTNPDTIYAEGVFRCAPHWQEHIAELRRPRVLSLFEEVS